MPALLLVRPLPLLSKAAATGRGRGRGGRRRARGGRRGRGPRRGGVGGGGGRGPRGGGVGGGGCRRPTRPGLARRVAEHLGVEALDSGCLARVAEQRQPEVLLDPAEQAVVVVGVLSHRARRYAGRERHRPDLAATGPRCQGAGVDGVVARLLVAAGARVARGPGASLGLVEGDQEEALILEGGGAFDSRDPFLQE